MPHVTFVHGIANKPEREELIRAWSRFLAREDGLNLSGEGVTTSAVYWADVLHKSPIESLAGYERAESEVVATDFQVGDSWRADEAIGSDERSFLIAIADRYGIDPSTVLESGDPAELGEDATKVERDGSLERVLLPWPIKRRIMRRFLRDVHHYLFDTEFEPRPGEKFRVQRDIRARFVDDLNAVPSGPHIVVAHSMGTVISYDCLMRVPECQHVDGLITLGSPLGIDEIQDKMRPEWSRENGFPEHKLRGRWVNFSDRLDPVCGLDPKLANDFQLARDLKVEDVIVSNPGTWKHSVSKYLAQPELRDCLAAMLAI